MTDWNPNDPDATKVYYDLSSWTVDQQAELASEMADAEIPHTWDHTELVVPEESEQAADLLIADVESRLAIESAPVTTIMESLLADEHESEPMALADGVPTTEYDLEEWTPADRDTLSGALTSAGIPFTWEGNVLLVGTDDEGVVDELLDDIESGEYVDADGGADEPTDAEPVGTEVLTTFFLAGERLRRDPLDPDGLEQLLAATDVADPEVPPFGVQPKLWQQTCELADQLTDALVEQDEPDAEAAMAAAEALYELLRPNV